VVEPAPTLNDLARDPALAADLSAAVRLRLLATAEGIAAVLRQPPTPPSHNGEAQAGHDDRLTAEQAAAMAGLTVPQFYSRKVFRPAIVKLGHRTLRVSERKLRRILAGLGA